MNYYSKNASSSRSRSHQLSREGPSTEGLILEGVGDLCSQFLCHLFAANNPRRAKVIVNNVLALCFCLASNRNAGLFSRAGIAIHWLRNLLLAPDTRGASFIHRSSGSRRVRTSQPGPHAVAVRRCSGSLTPQGSIHGLSRRKARRCSRSNPGEAP